MSKLKQRIRRIIAQECGMTQQTVNPGTPFVDNKDITYWDMVGALYTLQHVFKVKLPESDYVNYKTVGNLTNCIVAQVKSKQK